MKEKLITLLGLIGKDTKNCELAQKVINHGIFGCIICLCCFIPCWNMSKDTSIFLRISILTNITYLLHYLKGTILSFVIYIY